MENSLDLRMGVGRKGWLVSWDSGTSGPAGYTTEHLQCVMVIINQGPQGEEVTWFVMHLSLQFSFILVSLGPDVYFPQGREEWWGPYKVNFICIWTEEKKVAIVSKGRGLWPKSKRASGVTGGSTVASMHPYVYPCPWVISSPWVWVGFTDLLLMNRIWQKWWDLDAKRLLFQFFGGPHSLALKETSCHVVNALWSPCGKELMSLDTSHWGLEFCQQPWEWTRTVKSNLEMTAAWPDPLMELVWDPEPEATSKASWPTEKLWDNVHCFKPHNFGAVCFTAMYK